MKKPRGTTLAGVAIAISLSILVMFGTGLLSIVPTADTDAEFYKFEKSGFLWTTHYEPKGRFPDPVGDTRKDGELFSRTIIWIAWWGTGESYPITVQGYWKCRTGDVVCDGPDRIDYVFSINTGSGWKPLRIPGIPDGVVSHTNPLGFPSGGYFPAEDFFIRGYTYCNVDVPTEGGCPEAEQKEIIDGSVLRVTMVLKGNTGGTYGGGDKEGDWEATAGKDEVTVRSAMPEVRWTKQAFRVGENAVANYEIPTATDLEGNPAYFATVTDCNTQLSVGEWNRKPLTSTQGQISIPVVEAMFKTEPPCENRLRVAIYSVLIRVVQDDTSVWPSASLVLGDPPVVTEITTDKERYSEGETVNIAWNIDAKGGEITKVHLHVHMAGHNIVETDLAGDAREYSARVPTAGILIIEVTAYRKCLPSEVKDAEVSVGSVTRGMCELFPDAEECKSSNWMPWVLLIVGIIMLFVGLLIPMPLWLRLILIGIAILLMFGAIWWLGWI